MPGGESTAIVFWGDSVEHLSSGYRFHGRTTMSNRVWRSLTLAMGAAAILLLLASFLMKGIYHSREKNPAIIMIRKDSLHRILNQPCNIDTI